MVHHSWFCFGLPQLAFDIARNWLFLLKLETALFIFSATPAPPKKPTNHPLSFKSASFVQQRNISYIVLLDRPLKKLGRRAKAPLPIWNPFLSKRSSQRVDFCPSSPFPGWGGESFRGRCNLVVFCMDYQPIPPPAAHFQTGALETSAASLVQKQQNNNPSVSSCSQCALLWTSGPVIYNFTNSQYSRHKHFVKGSRKCCLLFAFFSR